MHFWNYLVKLKIPTPYYSDVIIVIIYANNSKHIQRLNLDKFLLNLSASASAIAPLTPILLSSKIMIKWKNNP